MTLKEAIDHLCSVYLSKESDEPGFCLSGEGVPVKKESLQKDLKNLWDAWSALYQHSDMSEERRKLEDLSMH